VLIAAHNEAELIGGTITSLQNQTRPPGRIIVMADNCTDETVAIARQLGVEVYETVGNTAKKAGALNQGFWRVRDSEMIVQVDADMVLDESFVEELASALTRAPDAGAVTARVGVQDFGGGGPASWALYMLQRHEYYYYDSMKVAARGRVWCISGTGGIYRGHVLRAVAKGRRGPWDEDSIVEDYSLSLDIEEQGWRTGAASRAFGWTDTMPTFRMLWRQRMRWNEGTYLEWHRRHPTHAVNSDRRSHRLGLVMTVMNPVYLLLSALLVAAGAFRVTPWSLAIFVLFGADRLYRLRYVPDRRFADYVVALTILPEFAYRLVLDVNLLMAQVRVAVRKRSATQMSW
jgi:cellulose synthase/poly-beta-1,6-N-acetylglucosamine synthase-like glycosyltransferase